MGTMVEIGLDVIKLITGQHSLYVPILRYMHNKGLFFLNHPYVECYSFLVMHSWLNVREISPSKTLVAELDHYILHLSLAGIVL